MTSAKTRLVLVEDDQDVRKSITLMLRGRGFSLDVFEGGVQLLATGHLPQADCLLIDYKMPKVDGIELLKRLRGSGLKVPAILITGFYSDALKALAQRAGFSRFLEKPASADRMVEAIESLTRP
ncbi:MAG: response regulator [Pseudomonadota bacterium]